MYKALCGRTNAATEPVLNQAPAHGRPLRAYLLVSGCPTLLTTYSTLRMVDEH